VTGKSLDGLVPAEDRRRSASASTGTGLPEAMPSASAPGRNGARFHIGASTPSLTREGLGSSELARHAPRGCSISARQRILRLPSEDSDARRFVETGGPSVGGAPRLLGRIHGR
jgi:hypothetical protein